MIAITLDSGMDWLDRRDAVLCLRMLAVHDAAWSGWEPLETVDEVIARLDRLRLAVVRWNRYRGKLAS